MGLSILLFSFLYRDIFMYGAKPETDIWENANTKGGGGFRGVRGG